MEGTLIKLTDLHSVTHRMEGATPFRLHTDIHSGGWRYFHTQTHAFTLSLSHSGGHIRSHSLISRSMHSLPFPHTGGESTLTLTLTLATDETAHSLSLSQRVERAFMHTH